MKKLISKNLFLALAVIPGLFAINVRAQVIKEYLFSSEIAAKVAAEKNAWNLQNLAVQYSFSGNFAESLATQKLFTVKNAATRGVPYQAPMKDDFKLRRPVDAVQAIAKEAEKYRVVITNEAHYQPQNRVFTTALLRALYDKGFRYFAFEDYAPDDEVFKSKNDKELNSRGYPVKATGYYILEPQYGNLVREAIRIGYKVVPYEHYASDKQDPVERLWARERGQAKNIAAILANDPGAKILVHSGYGHMNEHYNDGEGQMGGMLKNEFKIDPLTVDQEKLLEENNNPHTSAFALRKPSVFVDDKGGYFSASYDVGGSGFLADISVAFPKTKYINGRPDWLMYPGNRRYYFIRRGLLKIPYPLMILAYRKGEDIDSAIPADVIELGSAKESKALVLTKGDYTLLIKNQKGETQMIDVKF